MRKLRLASFFLLSLVLALFVGVPAEDLPDTVYDESESQPFDDTPLVSEAITEVAAERTQQVPANLLHELPVLLAAWSPRSDTANASRASGKRILLALLCTLVC